MEDFYSKAESEEYIGAIDKLMDCYENLSGLEECPLCKVSERIWIQHGQYVSSPCFYCPWYIMQDGAGCSSNEGVVNKEGNCLATMVDARQYPKVVFYRLPYKTTYFEDQVKRLKSWKEKFKQIIKRCNKDNGY
jgi:hypothetical protein